MAELRREIERERDKEVGCGERRSTNMERGGDGQREEGVEGNIEEAEKRAQFINGGGAAAVTKQSHNL